jgi:hypothetical protein
MSPLPGKSEPWEYDVERRPPKEEDFRLRRADEDEEDEAKRGESTLPSPNAPLSPTSTPSAWISVVILDDRRRSRR